MKGGRSRTFFLWADSSVNRNHQLLRMSASDNTRQLSEEKCLALLCFADATSILYTPSFRLEITLNNTWYIMPMVGGPCIVTPRYPGQRASYRTEPQYGVEKQGCSGS